MKWRIISKEIFRGQTYFQITNDIDTVDYIPEYELSKYGLKKENKNAKSSAS